MRAGASRRRPLEYGSGLTSIVIETGRPLLIQSREESIALGRVETGLPPSRGWACRSLPEIGSSA